MALKSTIFKAHLQIADMDRHYYGEHILTLARHPSETDERMMVRLLAFALNADPQLTFAEGICQDDEADLWQRDLTGVIKLWIEVGTPDEKRIRKACGRAQQLIVYCYGSVRTVDIWFAQNRASLMRLNRLSLLRLPEEQTGALADMAQRSMSLQCTIQDGQVWLSDGNTTLEINREVLIGSAC